MRADNSLNSAEEDVPVDRQLVILLGCSRERSQQWAMA
jgi:hypothetical protein